MPAKTAESSTVLADELKEPAITEVLNAPRCVTFRTSTDPALLTELLVLAGFTNSVC
jgi:hypothetical protein